MQISRRFGGLMAAMAVGLAIPAAHAADFGWAPAPSSWTSCYVGGNLGAAWDGTKVVDEVEGYPIASLSSAGLIGGGQIGCDYQVSSQWVIGAQGMIDASGMKDSVSPDLLDGATLNGSMPWFGTVTGRVGYLPAPNWMIYAKGGFAFSNTHSSITDGGTTIDSVSFNQTGWTAGLGAEWKRGPHWSFFGEYDYLGFSPTVVSFPNSDNIGKVKQNVQAVLFGVNYRFN
jgi:outer membrane immunogenic protein